MDIRNGLIAGVVLLAACGQSPEIDETNASVAEVAAEVRKASGDGGFVRPGQWSSEVTIEKFEVPGLPDAAAREMRAAMAQESANSFTSCLTADDVKQPKGKFFTGNDQCRYDHFRMADGKIDAALRCDAGGGAEQLMTMTGDYGPDRYELRMQMGGKGSAAQSSPPAMTMIMKVVSKRVGECRPDDSTAPATTSAGP